MRIEKRQACSCGRIEGKHTLLNSHAHVGITTKFRGDTGTFIDNKGLYLENNFCPQCGEEYIVIEIKDKEENKDE